jgi:hypothetical protein
MVATLAGPVREPFFRAIASPLSYLEKSVVLRGGAWTTVPCRMTQFRHAIAVLSMAVFHLVTKVLNYSEDLELFLRAD